MDQRGAEMQTTINYVANRGDGVVPFVLDTNWSGAERVPTAIEITDARPIANTLSLDRQGFILERIVSGVTDYRDPSQLEALWLPAAADLVKTVTGALWATWWAHNVRFSDRSALSRSTTVSAPARVVHSDLRPHFDPSKICEEPLSSAAAAEIHQRLGGRAPKRWRTFNVWQQISPPPQDTPLALCDSSTVAAEDLLNGQGTDGTPNSRIFGLTLYQRSPRHRWYYFSNMLPGEAVVFSGLDPQAGPVYSQVPHIAFDLPDCPANCVPRNSIEVRVLAAFADY
jgi:hypothetical protein